MMLLINIKDKNGCSYLSIKRMVFLVHLLKKC